MAQKQQGSVAAGVTVAVMLILVLSALGYYQFVYAPTIPTSTSTTAVACAPPGCVTIEITFGAATKTTDAYAPNPVKLVIGVNNTFQFFNNDSQSGGVVHSSTQRGCPQTCPFDTGVIAYNIIGGPYTISQPGTYDYYCVVHPTTMRGTIVVVRGTGGGQTSQTASTTTSSATNATTTVGPSTSSSASSGVAAAIVKGAGTNVSSLGFSPSRMAVVMGVNNTITWTNDDISPHTVTATDKSFDSGNLNPGQSFTYTFSKPGTYDYICIYHSWMKGTVVVKG
jgi:plastocyanin